MILFKKIVMGRKAFILCYIDYPMLNEGEDLWEACEWCSHRYMHIVLD